MSVGYPTLWALGWTLQRHGVWALGKGHGCCFQLGDVLWAVGWSMRCWRVSPAAFPSQGIQLTPSELLQGREQTTVNMEGWEICFNRTQRRPQQ